MSEAISENLIVGLDIGTSKVVAIVGEINEANWQQRVKPCLTVLNKANKNNDSPDLIQVEEMCK